MLEPVKPMAAEAWQEYTLLGFCIDKEKDKLEEENQALQQLLKQYLNGISIQPEIMNSPNPLLVVNGKVNVSRCQSSHMAPKVGFAVVDGAQLLASQNRSEFWPRVYGVNVSKKKQYLN